VDYDPAVNNGNWQWVASTGCDHQPYFRIFNPWLQQKRFDPDCAYIRKWVLELKGACAQKISDLGPKALHSDAAAWIKMAFKEASRRGKNG
jgi:deoxyribodipyrimidine photo-lyase